MSCSRIIIQDLEVKVPEGAGHARCWHLALVAIRKLAKENEKLLDAAISYEAMTCNFETDTLPKEAWEELAEAEAAMTDYRSSGKEV